MADIIRILNWNVAGAKYLETGEEKAREKYREKINNALASCIHNLEHRAPHIITLQEIVQYQKPNEPLVDFIDESKFPDYSYMSFPLIDTDRHAYTSKWKRITDIWKDEQQQIYFSQGNAIMSRKDLPILPIWSLARSSRFESKVVGNENPDGRIQKSNNLVENVIIKSGLYFGDRNTEPRCALVSHFVFDRNDSTEFIDSDTQLPIPQDVFVVNLHLTTLKGEREGVPRIDETAVNIRLRQLDFIFNDIISTYNDWAKSGFLTRKSTLKKDDTIKRFNPLWILCGDFNFTPQSREYEYVIRQNFVDTIPQKGLGTKASGFEKDASLTLDYIFAGPKFLSLEDHIVSQFIGNVVEQNIRSSDHRPMFSCIPLAYK